MPTASLPGSAATNSRSCSPKRARSRLESSASASSRPWSELDLEVEGSHVPVAASVGVAPIEGHEGLGPEELIALADKAMYVVKAGGGSGSGEARPAGRRPGAEPA